MIVTCPECQEKISEYADPCPHCGLPEAGAYSFETVRRNKPLIDQELEMYLSPSIQCPKCGEVATFQHEPSEVRALIGRAGFGVVRQVHGNLCGGSWESVPNSKPLDI
jgi:hypothetical protein